MKQRLLLVYVICAFLWHVHIRVTGDEKGARDNRWYVYTEGPEYTIDGQFRALVVKPTANNLYYAVEAFPFDAALTVPIASPRWEAFDFHPDHHFGFDVGVTGVFASRGSSLAINWEHFASSTCVVKKVSNSNNMIGPFSAIGPDSATYKQVQATVKFTFDEVNVRYGQYVHIGNFLHTNLFAGIGFAHLKQCMTTFFSDTNSFSRTFIVPTSFTGAGPECGFDLSYTIVDGLHLTGQFVAMLLMGTMKNHTTYLSVSPEITAIGNPVPNKQSTSLCNRTQLVPSFTERLGLSYIFCLCDERYEGKIEVGYESKILLNAIQTTDLASGVIGLGPINSSVGVFARTFERNLGNFALNGLYIALDVAV
jgi:hypothetical protein